MTDTVRRLGTSVCIRYQIGLYNYLLVLAPYKQLTTYTTDELFLGATKLYAW